MRCQDCATPLEELVGDSSSHIEGLFHAGFFSLLLLKCNEDMKVFQAWNYNAKYNWKIQLTPSLIWGVALHNALTFQNSIYWLLFLNLFSRNLVIGCYFFKLFSLVVICWKCFYWLLFFKTVLIGYYSPSLPLQAVKDYKFFTCLATLTDHIPVGMMFTCEKRTAWKNAACPLRSVQLSRFPILCCFQSHCTLSDTEAIAFRYERLSLLLKSFMRRFTKHWLAQVGRATSTCQWAGDERHSFRLWRFVAGVPWLEKAFFVRFWGT